MIVEQVCVHTHNSVGALPMSKILTKQPKLPLVWYNNGLYGIISLEKLQNMYDALQDQANLPVLDRKKDVGKFYWDDCVVIPSKIAKLLFGEKT